MIDLNTFKKIQSDQLPLLTLDEFFNGNKEEDSIAPNQWGEGRPALQEMWKMFQNIEKMPNAAWVRVALHDDTEIIEVDGNEKLILAGESIVVCTTMSSEELEQTANCEWLCSDGVIEMDIDDIHSYYSCVPSIPEEHTCLEIVWD